MKRTILFVMMVSCIIALLSAQGYSEGTQPSQEEPARVLQRRDNNNRPSRQQAESASVSGNLTIERGMIAVNSGDTTYIALGLQRFVGFIDGLKEGAAVTLEGNAYNNPRNDSTKILMVQKMTISGKEYDITHPVTDFMNQRQFQQTPRQVMPRQAPRQMTPRQMMPRQAPRQMPRQMPGRMNWGRR